MGTMLLDVRLYRIRPGKRDEFHALACDETIPLARRHGQVVVDFGPSTHDEDTYYLIRAFSDEADRRTSLEALYGSNEWVRDYDDRVMAMIESCRTAVFPAPAEAVLALAGRAGHGGADPV